MEKWNFSVGKWNFERTENLREECQPSYVPQSPSGDFAGVSILPRAGRRWLRGGIRVPGGAGGRGGVGRTVSYDFRLAPAIAAAPTAL